jgi:hypothetical protein
MLIFVEQLLMIASRAERVGTDGGPGREINAAIEASLA